MAKKIAYWRCDVCYQRYDTEKEAIECESRTPIKYPHGLIFGNHVSGLYCNITFSIKENNIHNHLNHPDMWACRDNGNGDSLHSYSCVAQNETRLNHHDSDLCISAPHFMRMIKYLLSIGIVPLFWNGIRPVSYRRFKLEKYGTKNNK
ncbi:MAG: hypothetical protein KAS32_13550 [Candidatus Peribacteraceae bacterium]|nr:hypothetical protein [Candidatus Peribacteraceae bacterium]